MLLTLTLTNKCVIGCCGNERMSPTYITIVFIVLYLIYVL